uniref:Oxidoreductase n=1 Tax=Solanum tuberosum TaxID=4113 RepID=M1D010_SOLTU
MPMPWGVQCCTVVAIAMVLGQQHQGRGSTCCCGAEGIRYFCLPILVMHLTICSKCDHGKILVVGISCYCCIYLLLEVLSRHSAF